MLNPKVADIYSDDERSVKLALCQVQTEQWDVAGNLQRTLKALEAAAQQDADLAITPECVLHGYGEGEDRDDVYRRCLKIAEPLDGPRLARIRELAKDTGMHIIVGFAERGAGEAIHNSATLISAAGEIVNVYRKVHCRNFEDISFTGPFTPGGEFVAAEITCGDVAFCLGTMICFDREVPESCRCVRALGAHLIACPLATDTCRLDVLENNASNEVVTRVRAAENEVFIAVVNHAGRFNGGSFVVGPGGEAIVQLGSEPEVRVVDIPIAALATKIRSEPYGWMGWGYRRAEVYARHLTTCQAVAR